MYRILQEPSCRATPPRTPPRTFPPPTGRGGDDKAAEYAHLVAGSSLVVLTKVDLRHRVTFDPNVFQSDLARLNPRVEVIHLSAYENTGMTAWLDWIEQRRAAKARERVAAQ